MNPEKNFNPNSLEHNEVKDLQEEQNAMKLKREAYSQAVEGDGLKGRVMQVLRVINGGKLSKDGELLAVLDAEREDRLRDSSDKDSSLLDSEYSHPDHWDRDRDSSLLDRYQKSYLKVERDARTQRAEGLSGEINGQQIKISRHIGMDSTSFEGYINGERITNEAARAIWSAYARVAVTQEFDIKSHHNNYISEEQHIARAKKIKEEYEQEAERVSLKNLRTQELKNKTSNLVKKLDD